MPIKLTVCVQYDAVKTGINLMTSEETGAEMETPQCGSSETTVNFVPDDTTFPRAAKFSKILRALMTLGTFWRYLRGVIANWPDVENNFESEMVIMKRSDLGMCVTNSYMPVLIHVS
jgi:hypothetical protein